MHKRGFSTVASHHLQGGSNVYKGGASDGALYIGATGTLTIDNATIKAQGSDGKTGGSGGIALIGGQSVTFNQATLNASGGKGTGGTYYGGGGGGRIIVGYPYGTTAPVLTGTITATGSTGSTTGGAGSITPGTFAGF